VGDKKEKDFRCVFVQMSKWMGKGKVGRKKPILHLIKRVSIEI